MVVDRALGPPLMKLSVEDVYRWGLPACGPFTATAAGLVKSCFTSLPVCRSGRQKAGGRTRYGERETVEKKERDSERKGEGDRVYQYVQTYVRRYVYNERSLALSRGPADDGREKSSSRFLSTESYFFKVASLEPFRPRRRASLEPIERNRVGCWWKVGKKNTGNTFLYTLRNPFS